MQLAHDRPFGGHLGNKKTREKILNHFTGIEYFQMYQNIVGHVRTVRNVFQKEEFLEVYWFQYS